MTPSRAIQGKMCPIYVADIDTDQIMPKQFLKRIERTGFGEFLFHDWRVRPDFVLNDPYYRNAKLLIGGRNFGCGSSREHAPWGIQQFGFEAVVAPSFADIFRSNCEKIGLLCIQLDKAAVDWLAEVAQARDTNRASVDVATQILEVGERRFSFTLGEQAKLMLLQGLDAVGLTMHREQEISAYELTRPAWLPAISTSNGRSGSRSR